MRSQIAPVLSLGIAGTAATFGLVAVAAHEFVGLSWTQALLLGAVLSPTDPAAVFAAVSRAGAGGARVVRLLEAEAGFNDPVAIALTLALVSAVGSASGDIDAGSIAWTTGRELVIGSAVGLVAGLLARAAARPSHADARDGAGARGARGRVRDVRRRRSRPRQRLRRGLPVRARARRHADLPQADAVRAFGEQLASLAEIAMFVLLGVALAAGAAAARARSTPRC